MIRKIVPWLVFGLLILLIVVGLASKDKLSQYLSDSMVKNAAPQVMHDGAAYIDSAYNYEQNKQSYQLTFLEFGAVNCVACRKMKEVMEEVKQQYPNRVNVVFYNILLPENQLLMKYFGVSVIPTQILLDRSGKEYFRHTGYISFIELEKKFKKEV